MTRKRLDWTKKYNELSTIEMSAFYDNVRKTTFGYISNRANDDELAYELINDAYMKAIEKADPSVTIRSLRSYIGTIAWHALYHRKIKKDPLVLYDPSLMPECSEHEPEEINKKPLPRYMVENIKTLNDIERQRLRDIIKCGSGTKALCKMWGMESNQVRSAVSRLRRKIRQKRL